MSFTHQLLSFCYHCSTGNVSIITPKSPLLCKCMQATKTQFPYLAFSPWLFLLLDYINTNCAVQFQSYQHTLLYTANITICSILSFTLFCITKQPMSQRTSLELICNLHLTLTALKYPFLFVSFLLAKSSYFITISNILGVQFSQCDFSASDKYGS